MTIARRILRWFVFLAVIAAIGVGVFTYVRSRPRVSIVVPGYQSLVAPDGSKFLTVHTDRTHGGKLQVWDAHDGRLLHEWAHDRDTPFVATSPDSRYYACFLRETGPLRLIDWQAGEVTEFAIPNHVNGLTFSPKGRWLFAMTAMGDPNYVIDMQSRKVVLKTRDQWPTFSADDRLMFDRKGKDRTLTVWDLEAGKALGEIPLKSAHYKLSPDSRLIVEEHHEPISEPLYAIHPTIRAARKDHQIDVWDVTTFKHRFHYRSPLAGNLQTTISPDGRRLAVWLVNDERVSKMAIVDTESGKVIRHFTMHFATECVFSRDGSLVCLMHQSDRNTHCVSMFDAHTGHSLWQQLSSGMSPVFFTNDVLLVQQDRATDTTRFVNARDGKPIGDLPTGFCSDMQNPGVTPDRRHVAIEGLKTRQRPAVFWETWLDQRWPTLFNYDKPAVLVMETATRRERFLGANCGVGGWATLSADGDTLVTSERSEALDAPSLIRVWDVPATKAWLWAIAATSIAALTWLGVARLWRRGSHAH